MKLITDLIVAICLIGMCGCKTYHLTTESLLTQFADRQEEIKVNVLIMPPFLFYPGIVQGNDLRTIKVLDAKDHTHILPVTKHTSIRITQKNDKRTTFYFDTLLLRDSTITGNKTHFFRYKIQPIYFANINKIEIQR